MFLYVYLIQCSHSYPLYLYLFVLQWTCTIATVSRLGEGCGVFNDTNTLLSSLVIPRFAMSPNMTYAFTVAVTAPDGRSDSRKVFVTPSYGQSVQLSITSTFVKFNPEAKLTITGNLRALSAVTSYWSVYSSFGVPIQYDSLTPRSEEFSQSSRIAYPLSIPGGTFIGGNSYSFRLTAYPKGLPQSATYSEIQLTANSPPSGGYLYVEPTTGSALVTVFFISSPGWTSEADCLPLRYSYAYRVSASSQYLSLAAASQRDYTRSTLPAGLAVMEHRVTMQGQATDMHNSSSTAMSTVTVIQSPSSNTSRILSRSLNRAFLTGDMSLAYQSLNGAATTINAVDCSASPNCSTLNREHCFRTAGSCGRCLEGYSGTQLLIILLLLSLFRFHLHLYSSSAMRSF